MIIWLVVVAVLALLWFTMWKTQWKMAIGVLIGLPVGWLFADIMKSYLASNMHEIPIWLPPLPFALAATLLIVVGLIVTLGKSSDSAADKSEHKEEH